MHQRLTPLKGQIPDSTPVQDRQRPGKCVCIDISRGAGQCFVSREAAKVARSVADIGNLKSHTARNLRYIILKVALRNGRLDWVRNLVNDRIGNDWAGHTIAAAATEFGPRNRDDLDAFVAPGAYWCTRYELRTRLRPANPPPAVAASRRPLAFPSALLPKSDRALEDGSPNASPLAASRP